MRAFGFVYLVFAAPHVGLCKLLQVPSIERYGDLIQRCGGMAQRGPFDICFGYDGPAIKLLKKEIKCIEKWLLTKRPSK